jgi:hypothetical protein
MPRFDGTGPRGEGMFTGHGEGYCALRLPEPSSDEPAVGYAGIEGRPLQLPGDPQFVGAVGPFCGGRAPWGWPRAGRGHRCHFGAQGRTQCANAVGWFSIQRTGVADDHNIGASHLSKCGPEARRQCP